MKVSYIISLVNECWIKTKQVAAVVRHKPFDNVAPENRSKERYRRIALTSFAAIAARGMGVLTALITVPLTLNYLGNERYGMWMTISSVIAMLGFADLGMGNGLLNAISEANGKNDIKSAKMYISSAFFLLMGIASCLLLAFAAIYWVVPWGLVYNLKSLSTIQEAGTATAVVLCTFIANMPLGVVQRAQMGYQEGFRTNIWIGVGSILGLTGVLVGIYLKAGLFWLVLAMSGAPVLALLFNWYDFFRSRQWLHPSWNAFNRMASRKVAGTGALFLILQILALLGNASDNLVIAQILGVSAVAGYSVTQKLFSITQVAQDFITPLWPAFGEAMACNDHAWAQRALNRALAFSLALGMLTALPLVFFGRQIIAIWVGPNIVPSMSLLLGFAFWVLLAGYGRVMSTFLSSGKLLGKQSCFFATASITSIILKILLVANWQIAGVIWATVLGYGIFYAIPSAKLAYGSLKEAKEWQNERK